MDYATPTYGTPPEGYPTSPDLLAAENRPFYSPWLEEEEEETGAFADGGPVTEEEPPEEPRGLASFLDGRQRAVNRMLMNRGQNGVR